MALYVVESTFHEIEHAGQKPKGVVGQGPGSEKLYLFVIAIDDAALAKLGPRVDEDGNKQHDRRALPGNEEWWIAVEGEKVWPGTVRPRVTSRCTFAPDGAPVPHPLDEAEHAAIEKTGAKLPPRG